MEKSKLNICGLAIQKTLAYSAVFKYPLSFYQIYANLLSKNRLSGKQIRKELKKQEKAGLVTKNKGRYHISSVTPVSWEERKRITNKLIGHNRWVFELLEKIPWLKMISVTGSAANYNMEDKSDIDLLFITSKNRLWLTRGFVFLMLTILNKLPKEHKNRELCPNIFIDESSLGWLKKRRNLYVAQNIISMQPIFDKDEMYFRFMSANKWVNDYYYNFKINMPEKFTAVDSSKSIPMNLVEKLAMSLQIKYMKKKMTTEIATEKLINFNKNDNSRWILKSYKSLLKSAL